MPTTSSALVQSSSFTVSVEDLTNLGENKTVEFLDEKFDGLKGLAKLLKTDVSSGLSDEELSNLEARKASFGDNIIEEAPMKSFILFLWEALQDKILMLLMFFSVISILFGVFLPSEGQSSDTGWIEGAAILIAVAVVGGVTAVNNYSKELKFRALNKVKNERLVKVIRAGKKDEISINQIVTGDVVLLDIGDYVPADGVFIDGHGLAIDESAMTGESVSVNKKPTAPFLLSGCQVVEGNGKMLVTCVGNNSEWGKLYRGLAVPNEETPLQETLGVLAKQIGLVGTVVAVLLFIVQSIIFTVEHADDEDFNPDNLKKFLQYFITSVTLIVVAVPEGLPLAVTIALAFSMKSMLKDNNLVRHLAACETMGGATNICSDKTGTLTENRMTVTNIWISNKMINNINQGTSEMTNNISKTVLDTLATGIAVNSNAFIKESKDAQGNARTEFIGNKTECALLVLTSKIGYNYENLRNDNQIVHILPFSSNRKRMSTAIRPKDNETSEIAVLHTKGASEIVLSLCDRYIDVDNNPVAITADIHENLRQVINNMSSNGLRTLAIAYRTTQASSLSESDENNLTLIALVGIEDPLRAEVPDAIRKCKDAGITVRMVTGDNILTATKIAKDCGILEEGYEVIDGPSFRKLSDTDLDNMLPKLRVLARSSPSDKHRLVTRLKARREVVAVTGDGTNDGPALKAADVGLAMGIAGTDVAKEASDIIIMDDNFASIVKSVMWGRNVRQNIQCFIQFQLTINIVALSIAFISAASGRGEPLKPIQLLWVNLIQDSLAALALATEPPSEKLLDRKPYGRTERLISPIMWRNMIGASIYNLLILLPMVYAGDRMFGLNEESTDGISVQYTMVFNAFVFIQLFNEINARKLDNGWNAFHKGIVKNSIFLGVIITTTILQIIFVQFGGRALETASLNGEQWLYCVLIGLGILPFMSLVRVFGPVPDYDWIKYDKKALEVSVKDLESGNGELPLVTKKDVKSLELTEM